MALEKLSSLEPACATRPLVTCCMLYHRCACENDGCVFVCGRAGCGEASLSAAAGVERLTSRGSQGWGSDHRHHRGGVGSRM
jgi:hypothetical protein